MARRGGATWWVLYALLPLMAGLLVVEHRAALTPVWQICMQIGIVLCIYGLVWLWIRVNTIALLRTGPDKAVKTNVYEANRSALWSKATSRSATSP